VSEMLTEGTLATIEARANAATGGPWHAKRAKRPVGADVMTAGDVGLLSDALPTVPGVSNPIVGEVFAERTRGVREDEQAMRDAEFICHARTDVPALIAAYREVLARISDFEVSLDSIERDG
jgi:hypothetical protein